MGNKSSRKLEIQLYKKGKLYDEEKVEMAKHPLAILFFRGNDFVSNGIRYLQARNIKKESIQACITVEQNAFSHVGLLVSKEILNLDCLHEDKLYVLESTMSGRLADGVYDINNRAVFGCQIRDLDAVMAAYDDPDDTAIAYAPIKAELLHKLWPNKEDLRNRFTELYKIYGHRSYDYNFYSLFAAVLPCMRKPRDIVERILQTEQYLFCSELVACIYTGLGFFPAETQVKDVLPMDYLGFDIDNLPVVIENPTYITIAKHHKPQRHHRIKIKEYAELDQIIIKINNDDDDDDDDDDDII